MNKSMIRQPGPKFRGFTLVEMLVAVSIFIISSLILVEIYLINLKTQEKTVGASLVISEARYAIEAIVREIRTGSINYSHYGGPINDIQSELAVGNIVFKKSSAGGDGCPNIDCLTYSIGGGVWNQLTSDDVQVMLLSFYIHPARDPLSQGATVLEQPRVTIVLTLQNFTNKPAEQQIITVQTTASSRSYKR